MRKDNVATLHTISTAGWRLLWKVLSHLRKTAFVIQLAASPRYQPLDPTHPEPFLPRAAGLARRTKRSLLPYYLTTGVALARSCSECPAWLEAALFFGQRLDQFAECWNPETRHEIG
jgi:hypothetical protein